MTLLSQNPNAQCIFFAYLHILALFFCLNSAKQYLQKNITATDRDMRKTLEYSNVIFVKLCVHFCVYVSKSLRKWTQTDTKVTFHPTHHPPPTHQETFFGLK